MFTTCKQVARCKKIVDSYAKYSYKHPNIFQDYGICKFSKLIPTIHSSQKIIMLGKKYEPLKDNKSKVYKI